MPTEKLPEILGYRRLGGRVGIRNHVAIVYTTNCTEVVARKLYDRFPVGTQLFGYPEGCSYRDAPVEKIVAMAQHASYAAVLVVGLGCEGTDAGDLARRIGESGQTVESITIQSEGGDLRTVERGSRILASLLQHASVADRAPVPVSELVVGAECGGSDATSGLVANPLVGRVADRLIDEGGTYMHAEPHELMGCAGVLAARAVDENVARDVRAAIEEAERESFESGLFHIGFGNIEGGLTTIEEKSYGCLPRQVGIPATARGFARVRAAADGRLLSADRAVRVEDLLRRLGGRLAIRRLRRSSRLLHDRLRGDNRGTPSGDQGDGESGPDGPDPGQRRLRRNTDHAWRADPRGDGRRSLRGDDRRRGGEADEIRDLPPFRGVAAANAKAYAVSRKSITFSVTTRSIRSHARPEYAAVCAVIVTLSRRWNG